MNGDHRHTASGHATAGDAQHDAAMSAAEHDRMMRQQALWAHFVALLLGGWLIVSPATLGFRSAALTRSDVASGMLVMLFALGSYSRRFGAWAQWANCLVGVWLLFAPLMFWAPDAAAYVNDTLVGALVIAFAVLIPGMPGMDMAVMMNGPDVPPGWSYNPSTWLQRAPIILLAAIGFFSSRYMAAYQLRHIAEVWDPVFGDGTRRILNSPVSKMFPVSDAGLGAAAYLLELLMGFMGDRARWRTMPWMVMVFALVVVPLGVTSIVLVILQPLAVGAWCFLCLLAALAMLAMVPTTLDEVVAMLQFLVQARREGQSVWHTFWRGGIPQGGDRDERLSPFDWSHPLRMFRDWLAGSARLLIAAALGGWLMFAPDVLGTSGRAASSDRLVGAIVVTVALIAVAEVVRALRFLNGLLGVWLVIAPLALVGYAPAAKWNAIALGIALLLLSLPRGHIRGHYGSWQRFIV